MFSSILRPVRLGQARNALATYLSVLDGSSDEERGQLVYSAHVARIRCEIYGDAPVAIFLAPFALPVRTAEDFASAMGTLRVQAEKEKDVGFIAGLTVWTQSLSGVIFPELRVGCRQMWGMLARGFESAQSKAEALHYDSVSDGSALLLAELTAIPDGLEPRDQAGNQLTLGIPGTEVIERRAKAFAATKAAREAAEHDIALSVAAGSLTATPMPSLEDRRKALEAGLAAAAARRK